MTTIQNGKENILSIAMVGYLNTVPLVHGLQSSSEEYNIKLDVPASCYRYFNDGEVDVALVPVGVLPLMPQVKIVTDYCIGCDGEVRTVCLFSNTKLEDINTIYLDHICNQKFPLL